MIRQLGHSFDHSWLNLMNFRLSKYLWTGLSHKRQLMSIVLPPKALESRRGDTPSLVIVGKLLHYLELMHKVMEQTERWILGGEHHGS